jgi:primosomal protein N' (replication factor Y) (superfamily II helicase)
VSNVTEHELKSEVSVKNESSSGPAYAEVAVPLHVSQTFTYRLPDELRSLVMVGARIVVPLGRSVVTGYIVALQDDLGPPSDLVADNIKYAQSLVDSVPVCSPEILQISCWVSDYYASPLGEVIKATLPPGITPAIHEYLTITAKGRHKLEQQEEASSLKLSLLSEIAQTDQLKRDALTTSATPSQVAKGLRDLEESGLIERSQSQSTSFVKAKLRRYVRLRQTEFEGVRLSDGQLRVLTALQNGEPIYLQELLKLAGVNASTITSLEKRGLLETFAGPMRRDPLALTSVSAPEDYVLTPAQSAVLEKINEQIGRNTYAAFLLHGVTGSGKTEVYIRAMRTALNQGRSAMMLVPEIALTPVFSRRLRAHFGDEVAIFHSSLQRGERFDEWTRVKNGDARVVIGTRSAVFAPVKNLGLIVVDEEHEATYRQQDSPQYNGRDTAIVRAQKESATVVLGSATPSLESFHNTRTGKYAYLHLPERIAARPMATASIIDMRQVFASKGKAQVFSEELLEAIRETHEKKEQSIILLNRRGYSSFVLCRSCGETIQCPNCDVTLTYHRSERVLICHYCNHRKPSPLACPACGKNYIYYVGEGTEQLEEILRNLFPTLRIARIDRDTTARRRRFEKSLLDFSEGRLDLLVGTQMLAKGHDFPNVTLVGVVSVDAGLALADFRAAERTFQLLTQVAGRAGRGDRPGRVLIQTYHPHHYALRHSCAQDYEGFYNEEIRYRQNHSYPPFVALATLLVHGPDLNRVRSDALELRKELDLANKERTCRILGPAPAPLARLKGEHRFQLLIKSKSRRQLRTVADLALQALSDRGVNLRSINLEIDPVSVM